MSGQAARQPNGDSTNVALMKAMGSKSGEWDPIPPQQYEALMDKRETEEIRILGALLKRTIGRADDGTRSPAASERNGRLTRDADLVLELGISKGNLSAAIDRLVQQDKIRIERKPTRIYLRADVPAPDLGDPDEEAKANERRMEVFRRENFNARELQFLTQLHELDPEQFQAAIARIVAAELWGAQVKADAIAWAREREAEQVEQVFMQLGYTSEEKRGAARKRPPSDPERPFQVPVDFEKFSAQNTERINALSKQISVQGGQLIVNTGKPNSVQTAHPYGPELQSSESQLASQGEVNAKPKTSEAELKREAARAEIKNEITTRLHRARLTVLGAAKIDAGTLSTLASDLARLDTAGAIREVLEVFEERAREIKNGKRAADGWGYLVKTVRGEVDKRLPVDLKTQVKATAAGKGKW